MAAAQPLQHLIQHFITMAGSFNAHMQQNQNLVVHDPVPSPHVNGFNAVPNEFRPAVYKMIHNALRVENFSLAMVLEPAFGYVQDIPILLAMENRVAALEASVATLQAGQATLQTGQDALLARVDILQGGVDTLQASINQILQHLNLAPPVQQVE